MKSKLFITFGAFFLLVFVYQLWERYAPLPLTSSHIQAASDSDPVTIQIPSLSLKLPVISSELRGTKWEYATDGVSYLSSSAMPGRVGNAVFYGHNWPNLLKDLDRIKPGDEISIIFKSGTQSNFIVISTSVVDASETSILSQTVDSRLTLYTCTGFLDLERFVVVAVAKN